MPTSRYDDLWFRNFFLTISFSLIFAAIGYLTQFYVFNAFQFDTYFVFGNFLRMLRMFIGYIVPSYYFIKKYKGNLSDLGIPTENKSIIPWVAGISVYLIVGLVFIRFNIFFSTWENLPILPIIANFFIIAIMVSITDLWTRGFILFQLRNRYNDWVAIIGQNMIWFLIHIYEIDLLNNYISVYHAILLTLFLGFSGDIVALRYNDIRGLIFGHVLLNFVTLLAATVL